MLDPWGPMAKGSSLAAADKVEAVLDEEEEGEATADQGGRPGAPPGPPASAPVRRQVRRPSPYSQPLHS